MASIRSSIAVPKLSRISLEYCNACRLERLERFKGRILECSSVAPGKPDMDMRLNVWIGMLA